MPDLTSLITPDTRLERTRAGQIDMLTEGAPLTPVERRLMAIVNGYTPLRSLLALLGESEVPRTTIKKLIDAGLIRFHIAPARPNMIRASTSGKNSIEWFGAR